MASTSETSYWINFFTTAGIPAGDAAHYAILFTDNRITRAMLMDINKEYLNDMGITRLGDVIAILKHCKSVFTEEAKDKLLKTTSLTSLSAAGSSLTPRRSTAASRMVNHITSKHPDSAPMSSSPVPKLPPPDPPRSKRKVSVFERLGADGSDEVTINTSLVSAPSPQSVFNRLGGKAGMKRTVSGSSLEDLDRVMGEESLPYAGVLKTPPSGPTPAKRANIKVAVTNKGSSKQPQVKRLPLKFKKNITTTTATVAAVEEKKMSNIQRPEISTTTEGVLSDYAKEAPSLRDRLGSKSEPTSTTGNTSAKGKVTSTAKGAKSKSGIQARLGMKQEETASSSSSIVSSTENINANLKKERALSTAATAEKSKPSGIFSRLGKKSTV